MAKLIPASGDTTTPAVERFHLVLSGRELEALHLLLDEDNPAFDLGLASHRNFEVTCIHKALHESQR